MRSMANGLNQLRPHFFGECEADARVTAVSHVTCPSLMKHLHLPCHIAAVQHAASA